MVAARWGMRQTCGNFLCTTGAARRLDLANWVRAEVAARLHTFGARGGLGSGPVNFFKKYLAPCKPKNGERYWRHKNEPTKSGSYVRCVRCKKRPFHVDDGPVGGFGD